MRFSIPIAPISVSRRLLSNSTINEIDIGIRPGFAVGDGTEQGQMQHPGAFQLLLMGAQCGDDVILVHGGTVAQFSWPIKSA